MSRPGKHAFLAMAAVVTTILTFTTATLRAQTSSSTPSVSALATRVSALETRVAALEPAPSGTVTTSGANATFSLEARDPFNWSTRKFTIEAGGIVTVKNTGVLPHTFTVAALSIDQLLDPGQTVEVIIPADAKPGKYKFYCNVPGHEQAGMVGTMTVVAKGAGSPAATASGSGGPGVTLDAVDIGWSATRLTVKPGDTITIVNKGMLPHDFSVDALKISQPLDPGKTYEIKIPDDAKPGDYEFYCNVPGHKQAGMVGTLTVSGEGKSPLRNVHLGNPATAPATVPAAAQTIDVPPFRVTITDANRTDSIGSAHARGIYVAVNTSVLNTSNAPASIINTDLAKATLRDSQGRTFSLDIPGTVAASTNLLSQLQPGLTYDVALVFDVPADASGFMLILGSQEVPLRTVSGT